MTYRGYGSERSRGARYAWLGAGALVLVVAAGVVAAALFGLGGGRPPHLPPDAQLVTTAPPEADGPRPTGATAFPVSQRNEPLPSGWIPQPWKTVSADPSSRAVDLTWSGGCSDGYVLYVDEHPRAVTIDVWEDPATLDGEEDCTAAASPAWGRAKLAAPLGDRRLLRHAVQSG